MHSVTEPPLPKRKRAYSSGLFCLAVACLAMGGWELATGTSVPFLRGSSRRMRPVTEDAAYNMLFVGGAFLAAGCFVRAWESR